MSMIGWSTKEQSLTLLNQTFLETQYVRVKYSTPSFDFFDLFTLTFSPFLTYLDLKFCSNFDQKGS